MKTKFLLVIILLVTVVWRIGWAENEKTTGNSECKWTYKLTGERKDGQGKWDKEMTVTERCYDFDSEGRRKQNLSDKADYAGYDYRESGPPSQRQDCAGYTFEKLFGKGPYWIDAANFDDGVIFWFGKEIFRPGLHQATWGDVRPGDVVVYRQGGKAKHITWVRNVETTAGVVTKIWIDTKDAKQGVFIHPIGFFEWPNDPLTIRMGDIYIYRVDTSKVQAELVSKTCECPPLDPDTGKPKPTEEKKAEEAVADEVLLPKVDGKEPSPPGTEEKWAGNWKGRMKTSFNVNGAATVKDEEVTMQIVKDGNKVRIVGFGGTGEKGKEMILEQTPSNPNVAMTKIEKAEAIPPDGRSTTKVTLVVFLREGRLYLSQHLSIIGVSKNATSTITGDSIGIADRVKE